MDGAEGGERKNVTCSDGSKNVSEEGGVFKKAQVSGWKSERKVCLAV